MGNVTYYGNQQAVYAYGNDQWKVKPNLTLDLGLRYELTTVPLSQTQLQPLNAISSVPGLITFGAPSTQTTNFLPRVGFAYSPGGSGTTSIRGGFGMAVDVLYDNLGILSLPPQVQQTCDGGPPGRLPQTRNLLLEPDRPSWRGGGLPRTSRHRSPTPQMRVPRPSAYIPNQSSAVLGDLEPRYSAHVCAEVHPGRSLRRNQGHSPAGADSSEPSRTRPACRQYLPTYLRHQARRQLDSLPNTLADQRTTPALFPRMPRNGFNGSNVIGFMNYGASNYNGLQTQFSRNFTNGLQFQAAWTWSHAFDNSTADVFSTYLTPRRPQDFQNFAADWSTSALDRRHRVTIEAIYDLPFFKNSNWMMKNVVGNWQFAPIYTFESPEYATVQSGLDSNGNGDTAGDRAIYNPAASPEPAVT